MEPTQMPESTPQVTAAPVEAPAKPKSSAGILIALIIVVLALAAAAFFFLKERVAENMTGAESDISSLQEQSPSTDPAAIEADLAAETPDTFNQELDTAFEELDASFEAQ